MAQPSPGARNAYGTVAQTKHRGDPWYYGWKGALIFITLFVAAAIALGGDLPK